ncbi:hypothetical protein BGZ57DRAFT_801707 [Hyaloscypha finlandica]|nr:hypothetical protein BGZ57DRAFT_801707 [Hyaloscypha finlandica]KAH8760723.1 hypothetical protein F5882DRAFT_336949 [Hyaloscypha sp. PMI_1271]
MLGTLRRSAVITAIGICVLVTVWLGSGRLQNTSFGSSIVSTISQHTTPTTSTASTAAIVKNGHLPASASLYFNQVFSPEDANPHDFPALRKACDRATWHEDVYLQCGGMFAGMTSIMSEVKVCFKMAVEAGTGLVLPRIPIRDNTNLLEFNKNDNETGDAYMPYDQWFDTKHLVETLGRACPRMKIIHPDQLKPDHANKVAVKNHWEIDVEKAPGYHFTVSHFWTGNPFRKFFDDQLAKLEKDSSSTGTGISVIKIASLFLLYNITNDPTGGDLKLWNELAMLIRFLQKPRQIVNQLLTHINRPYYGVHFRAENDSIWNSAEDQMNNDLDVLDKAWAKYGKGSASGINSQKPLVYLACGDEKQVEMFAGVGKTRGWEVTHKWELAQKSANPETLEMINALPFDFQGAVDMGMMVQSYFFIGISGSAFSNTVAHARDPIGRYRWSSLEEEDDGGARTHIVNDGVQSSYPCCL